MSLGGRRESHAHLRLLGATLTAGVGLGFVALGVDDLRMGTRPPMQERYFARSGGLSAAARASALAAFDSQGGLFLAAGLGRPALAAARIRRGERWAVSTAAAMIVFGLSG